MRAETVHLLQLFAYAHLPPALQEISRPFGELARNIATGSDNLETTEALRKLLEAKDCAVRATLLKPGDRIFVDVQPAPDVPGLWFARCGAHSAQGMNAPDALRKLAAAIEQPEQPEPPKAEPAPPAVPEDDTPRSCGKALLPGLGFCGRQRDHEGPCA